MIAVLEYDLTAENNRKNNTHIYVRQRCSIVYTPQAPTCASRIAAKWCNTRSEVDQKALSRIYRKRVRM